MVVDLSWRRRRGSKREAVGFTGHNTGNGTSLGDNSGGFDGRLLRHPLGPERLAFPSAAFLRDSTDDPCPMHFHNSAALGRGGRRTGGRTPHHLMADAMLIKAQTRARLQASHAFVALRGLLLGCSGVLLLLPQMWPRRP